MVDVGIKGTVNYVIHIVEEYRGNHFQSCTPFILKNIVPIIFSHVHLLYIRTNFIRTTRLKLVKKEEETNILRLGSSKIKNKKSGDSYFF